MSSNHERTDEAGFVVKRILAAILLMGLGAALTLPVLMGTDPGHVPTTAPSVIAPSVIAPVLAGFREAAAQTAATVAGAAGVEVTRSTDTFAFADALGDRRQVDTDAWFAWLDQVPLMWLALLGGAIVVARTWPMGWLRKLIVFALAAAWPIFAVGVGGVVSGVGLWMASGHPDLVGDLLHGSVGAACLSGSAAMVLLIWFLLKMVSSEPSDPADRTAPAGRLTGRTSGLMWVLLGLLGAQVVAYLAGVQPQVLLRGLPQAVAATVLGVLALCGDRWAARFVWIPLLGQIGVLGAVGLMLGVLVANDELTGVMNAERLAPDLAVRLRRRAARILLAPAMILVIGGLLLTAATLVPWYVPSPLVNRLAWGWVVVLPAGLVACVVEAALSRRSGGARRRLAIAGAAAAVVLLAADSLVAPRVHRALAAALRPVPAPRRVRLRRHRLVNFPAAVGPYVLVGGERNALNHEGLRVLGMLDCADNWYFVGTFRNLRREPDRAGMYRLEVYQYARVDAGGMRFFPAPAEDGEPALIDLALPDTPPPWDRIQVRRIDVPDDDADGPGRGDYCLYSLNGRPAWSGSRVRRALDWPRFSPACYARISVTALGGEDPSQADQDCRAFLQTVLPEVLAYLPTAADVRRAREQAKAP